jgi:hypothetical protein
MPGQFNPNWPMDAALKLGVDGPFRNIPPQFGDWLGTRAKRGFGTSPVDVAKGAAGSRKRLLKNPYCPGRACLDPTKKPL